MPLRTTTIGQTTTLTSPPSLVFAVVMSPETAPLIDPAVREWRADSRPIGVGTRFSIRGRLGPIPIRGMSEVVSWNPPALAEFRSTTPTWPFRMTARHRFEDVAGGGAEYTWSISFHEVNVIARPLIALAARLFRRAVAAQAEMLRAHLDERSDSEPLPRRHPEAAGTTARDRMAAPCIETGLIVSDHHRNPRDHTCSSNPRTADWGTRAFVYFNIACVAAIIYFVAGLATRRPSSDALIPPQ